jgi:hypothetical protein
LVNRFRFILCHKKKLNMFKDTTQYLIINDVASLVLNIFPVQVCFVIKRRETHITRWQKITLTVRNNLLKVHKVRQY